MFVSLVMEIGCELEAGRTHCPARTFETSSKAISESGLISTASKLSTDFGKSSGSEKLGRREPNPGLPAIIAVPRFERGRPPLAGFYALLQAGGECWSYGRWRRGWDSNPR
jgi:hypothetical protein